MSRPGGRGRAHPDYRGASPDCAGNRFDAEALLDDGEILIELAKELLDETIVVKGNDDMARPSLPKRHEIVTCSQRAISRFSQGAAVSHGIGGGNGSEQAVGAGSGDDDASNRADQRFPAHQHAPASARASVQRSGRARGATLEENSAFVPMSPRMNAAWRCVDLRLQSVERAFFMSSVIWSRQLQQACRGADCI